MNLPDSRVASESSPLWLFAQDSGRRNVGKKISYKLLMSEYITVANCDVHPKADAQDSGQTNG